jgi:hypothetical protein
MQQSQGGYFAPQHQQMPPQMQGYYTAAPQQLQPNQFPQQQYQNVQSQPLAPYPSPPTSTVSAVPPSDSGYGYQTGYSPQGAVHQGPSYSELQDSRATYAGGIPPQQIIPQQHSELQGHQGSGHTSPVPQQNPRHTGQGPQQDYQMGYSAPGTEQQSAPTGNSSELQGYQSTGYIPAPSQQQVRALEQRSSQQSGSAQFPEAQESAFSKDVDPTSLSAPQSPQQTSPSSVSRRPVPRQASDAHELD